MRILITGSREWKDVDRLYAFLDNLYETYGDDLVLMHGGASYGVDAIVGWWAEKVGFPKANLKVYRPEYSRHWARVAPKMRNKQMVEERPNCVEAFWTTKDGGTGGTANCIAWAVARRVPVNVTIEEE